MEWFPEEGFLLYPVGSPRSILFPKRFSPSVLDFPETSPFPHQSTSLLLVIQNPERQFLFFFFRGVFYGLLWGDCDCLGGVLLPMVPCFGFWGVGFFFFCCFGTMSSLPYYPSITCRFPPSPADAACFLFLASHRSLPINLFSRIYLEDYVPLSAVVAPPPTFPPRLRTSLTHNLFFWVLIPLKLGPAPHAASQHDHMPTFVANTRCRPLT